MIASPSGGAVADGRAGPSGGDRLASGEMEDGDGPSLQELEMRTQ